MHDVLIIGSGVIGMSIARQLSATNYDIAIIDRDVPGKHASYKAGGMLGAQNEFTEDNDLYKLAIESREMFPKLSESLLNETGIDIQFKDSGLIKIANQEDDLESLTRQYEFLNKWILVSNYYPMMNLYSLPMGMLNQLMAQFIYQMMVKSMLINTRKLCLNRYNNITSHDIITKRFNRLIEEMATTLCVLTKCHLLKHIK